MKVLFGLAAVAMIAAALLARGPQEAPAAAHGRVITMGHEEFGRSVVTIRAGGRLTFANTSHWLHVIVPGKRSQLNTRQQGLPSFGSRDAHLSERGEHPSLAQDVVTPYCGTSGRARHGGDAGA